MAIVNGVFDFLTIGLFAGLIVLFLNRSLDDQVHEKDEMWRYLAAAVCCAIVNYLGNEVSVAVGAVGAFATVAFIVFALRPFAPVPRR